MSTTIDDKLNEFKQDLALFRNACDEELRRNLNTNPEPRRGEDLKVSAKTANEILLQISQQTNMLRSQNLCCPDPVKTPDLTLSEIRRSSETFGDLPPQIYSLSTALSRLSGASIQRIIDRSVAKMDAEYLSLISYISERISSSTINILPGEFTEYVQT